MLGATWANVGEHAAGPPDYWGSMEEQLDATSGYEFRVKLTQLRSVSGCARRGLAPDLSACTPLVDHLTRGRRSGWTRAYPPGKLRIAERILLLVLAGRLQEPGAQASTGIRDPVRAEDLHRPAMYRPWLSTCTMRTSSASAPALNSIAERSSRIRPAGSHATRSIQIDPLRTELPSSLCSQKY